MVILLIAILQLISTALWLTSSGLTAVGRIRNRVLATQGKKSFGNDVVNAVNTTSVKAIKLIRMIVNVLKYCLTVLLSLILVFDIIVLLLIAAVGSAFLFMMGG